MASKTGIRRIVVLPVVTGCAVVGNRGVRAVEGVIVVVNGKSSRCPIRRGGVAACAIGREIQRYVVWVGTLVVIRRMAACTSIRRVRIIAVVAGNAVIRDRNVCPGERVYGIMIESRRRPGGFRVASRAVGRKLVRGVVGICRLVEIGGVTACAGVQRIVVIPVMASRTLVGNGCVRAVQRIIIVVDGKSGWCPTGSSRMARSAVG